MTLRFTLNSAQFRLNSEEKSKGNYENQAAQNKEEGSAPEAGPSQCTNIRDRRGSASLSAKCKRMRNQRLSSGRWNSCRALGYTSKQRRTLAHRTKNDARATTPALES